MEKRRLLLVNMILLELTKKENVKKIIMKKIMVIITNIKKLKILKTKLIYLMIHCLTKMEKLFCDI